jgi:uncharacterized membrane protein YphA (DoxX/SURF4 family)
MERTLRRLAAPAVERAPEPTVLARVGLGAMVLAAGVHKLLDPAAWAVYVVPWLEPLIVLSPVEFMLLNGWLELLFGLALVADRYTALSSLVAAVSLSATVGYLFVVWLTTGGVGDVLARDVGLAALGWAVFVEAVRERDREA